MEFVVLVDEQNNPVGKAPKETVHTKNTPLHRAFSLFVFNSSRGLLLTKRAGTKKTFPGVWTNSVCGHPGINETAVEAAGRRLSEELGISGVPIREVSPYRYRFTDANGIVENEICPILVAFTDIDPIPDPAESDEWKWMPWEEFLRDILVRKSGYYSPWCIEEAKILASRNIFDG